MHVQCLNIGLNKNWNMTPRDLVLIIISIVIAVIFLKVFVWLLPFLVVLVVAFFIYAYLSGRFLFLISLYAEVAATAPSPHATTHCFNPAQTSPTAYT